MNGDEKVIIEVGDDEGEVTGESDEVGVALRTAGRVEPDGERTSAVPEADSI